MPPHLSEKDWLLLIIACLFALVANIATPIVQRWWRRWTGLEQAEARAADNALNKKADDVARATELLVNGLQNQINGMVGAGNERGVAIREMEERIDALNFKVLELEQAGLAKDALIKSYKEHIAQLKAENRRLASKGGDCEKRIAAMQEELARLEADVKLTASTHEIAIRVANDRVTAVEQGRDFVDVAIEAGNISSPTT